MATGCTERRGIITFEEVLEWLVIRRDEDPVDYRNDEGYGASFLSEILSNGIVGNLRNVTTVA